MANKRQSIITAVKTRLQGILTASGYNYNLGSNVFEWKDKALADAELPGLIFRDPSFEKVLDVIGLFTWRLNIEIEIHAQSSTAPADMRKMLSDVYKAIGVDEMWGGLALASEQPEGDEMQVQKDQNITAKAVVRFSILYRTPMWEN